MFSPLQYTIENAFAFYKSVSHGKIYAEYPNLTFDRDGRYTVKCFDITGCGCQCHDKKDIPPGSSIRKVLGIADLVKISEDEFKQLWMQCEYPPNKVA